jgi:hypothetical protein
VYSVVQLGATPFNHVRTLKTPETPFHGSYFIPDSLILFNENLICIFYDNLSSILERNLLSFLPKWNILNTERFLVIRDTSVSVTLACDDTLLIIAHIQAAQDRGYWCSINICC